MKTFISVQEARETVLSRIAPMSAETVALSDSLGRTLAEEVRSDVDSPAFDNSAMDGYAVRSSDFEPMPARLNVVGMIPAGSWPEISVARGQAAQIMTGAPVPEGADCIAPVEWTTREGDMVEIGKKPKPNQHVRHRAEDLKMGDRLLGVGELIDTGAWGQLATAGRSTVQVRRRPRIAIITTGDEIVPVDVVPGRGELRNSNAWAMRSQILQAGADVSAQLHAKDDLPSIRAALEKAASSDAIVISGGVSMGEFDLVRVALEAEGFEPAFWKVRQRPGKPLAFGWLGDRPVFGLPGNPVSSTVCLDQYVRPAIYSMLGRDAGERGRLRATLTGPFKKVEGLHFFARGILSFSPEGVAQVGPTGPQGSNLFSSVRLSNCIVHLPAEWKSAEPGTLVEVEQTDW